MSKKSKAKKIILEIVKKFFNKRNSEIYIHKKLIPTLDKYIKETSMDGIAYLVLKNEPDIPKEFLKNLKERFKVLKQSYNDSKQVFDKIRQLPFKKILLKENTFKYTNKQYKKGSRYSCDIDFFSPAKNIFDIYKALQKNSFYTNALDIDMNKKIIDILGAKTNKNISKYPILKKEKESLIQEQIYKEQNYDPLNPLQELRKGLEQQINTLKNIVDLYKKFETGDFHINKELKKIINSLSQNTKKLIQSNGEKDLIDQKKLLKAENKFLQILQEEKNNNLSGIIIILEETLSWLRKGLQKNLYTEELKNYSENLTNIFNKHINKIIKLRQIINKNQELHSFYKNGIFIDLHFNKKLFYNNIVKININKLNKIKIAKNLYSIAPEDSIIIDACHFVFNLAQHKNSYAFQGFLKYITDLLHKIKFNNIDWKKIVNIAKKTQSSSQVWFYLKIAKKYLKIDISQEILKQLKKDGYKGQIILLSLIPKKSLLFNKTNLFVKLYSKSYLENGLINKFVQKIHHIYNNFSL